MSTRSSHDRERQSSTVVLRDRRMRGLARREFFGVLASLSALALPRVAGATLMRGLTLRTMLARSQHVVVVSRLDFRTRYLDLGGRRSIVTETRVRVEDVLAQASPVDGELWVRTLGGVLDGVGELAHGQAELGEYTFSVAFLTRGPDAGLWVTGMAQGHYPLVEDRKKTAILRASPHLPTLRDWEHSAVQALVGRDLAAARLVIRDASER